MLTNNTTKTKKENIKLNKYYKNKKEKLPPSICFETATTLLEMLRNGEIRSLDLLDAFIKRAQEYNTDLNAIVTIDLDYAREKAINADKYMSYGKIIGPLHGLPMTIKNLPECYKMSEDYELLLNQLECAGAVVYGRTNIPINGQDLQTYNKKHGVTNNPWDKTRTPGGSSGGSSASLAACFTPLEIGSDIGGSIRVPASHCGVFGHKPTFGAVCARGTTYDNIGLGVDMSMRGPMARNVKDLQLLMKVITKPPGLFDIYRQPVLSPPIKKYLKDFRIAVWEAQEGFPVSEEVTYAIRNVCGVLKNSGATVNFTARPQFDAIQAHKLYLQLLGAAVAAASVDFTEHQVWIQNQKNNYENNKKLKEIGGNLWKAEGKGSLDFVIENSVTQTHAQWHAADLQRNTLRLKWSEFFKNGGKDKGGFDALLMPIYPCPAIKHIHSEGDILYPHTLYGPLWRPTKGRTIKINNIDTPYHDAIFWSGFANAAYLPSTAFPAGRGKKSGLPIGLQLIGPEGNDYCTIALAGLLEEAGFKCELPPGYTLKDLC